ncbi:unnamed protein product [Caenorhabditis angaria]|uniref:Uncharacterized protein n=1 Tax=Caenorhabditis angaria TaxID=860376 RepID=A0A9P1IQQ6_9PELO|nr:unnamed protein product [Caenorhabditis angaria]
MTHKKEENDEEWLNVKYEEEIFIQEIMQNNRKFVDMGAQIYKKFNSSENMTFIEARIKILRIACKIDYLSRMISAKGQLPMKELYENVRCQFESEEHLEKFIIEMCPIFLYFPGRQNPRNTSDGFRKLVFELARILRSGFPVNEENIENIIQQIHPDVEVNKGTFGRHEFYLDFKSLKSLAAQVHWFKYDSKSKSLQLTPESEDSLILSIDILRPRNILKRDASRLFCCNAVVTKSYTYYLKARIVGANKLSGYGAYILSMFQDGNEAALIGFNIPAKTYISVIGQLTPNEACQITVRSITSSIIGQKMFETDPTFWGDRNDLKMVYTSSPDKIKDEETEVVEKPEFKIPSIQELCDIYEEEMKMQKIREASRKLEESGAYNTENLFRELERQCWTADVKCDDWIEKHNDVVQKSKNKKGQKELLFLRPKPYRLTMDFESKEELENYLVSNSPSTCHN